MTGIMVATDGAELAQAHGDLRDWVAKKRAEAMAQVQQLDEAITTAMERKWATAALHRELKRAQEYSVFLNKVDGALAAGYRIVPNFDMQQLAIRDDRDHPRRATPTTGVPILGSKRLPAGEGRFVSAEPEFESWTEERLGSDGKTSYEVTVYQATEHAPVAVPFVLMEKKLADALHEAMEERLFDEIGIVSDQNIRRRDPVLVGRIYHPRTHRYNLRAVSFYIGWWFDPRTLDP